MSQQGFRKTGSQPVRSDWKDRALCVAILDAEPRLFDRLWGFTDPVERPFARVGKQICAVCPVREECLGEAIVDGRQSGIYGGLNLSDRKYAARIIEETGALVRDPKWAGRADRIAAIVRYVRATPRFYEQVSKMADELRHQRRWEQKRARKRAATFTPAYPSQSSRMQPLF
jgi:hypothetical protein